VNEEVRQIGIIRSNESPAFLTTVILNGAFDGFHGARPFGSKLILFERNTLGDSYLRPAERPPLTAGERDACLLLKLVITVSADSLREQALRRRSAATAALPTRRPDRPSPTQPSRHIGPGSRERSCEPSSWTAYKVAPVYGTESLLLVDLQRQADFCSGEPDALKCSQITWILLCRRFPPAAPMRR
jgi:hypothetical protein